MGACTGRLSLVPTHEAPPSVGADGECVLDPVVEGPSSLTTIDAAASTRRVSVLRLRRVVLAHPPTVTATTPPLISERRARTKACPEMNPRKCQYFSGASAHVAALRTR